MSVETFECSAGDTFIQYIHLNVQDDVHRVQTVRHLETNDILSGLRVIVDVPETQRRRHADL